VGEVVQIETEEKKEVQEKDITKECEAPDLSSQVTI
jgi:hypothetical protein